MDTREERCTPTRAPSTAVLGVEVSAVNLDQATAEILRWIGDQEKHYVSVTGVHGVIEAQDHPEFKRILNGSGLVVPDGMPLVWLSRLAGQRHVGRVYGPDLTLSLSRELARSGRRAFYYGGAPGVADRLARVLEGLYPGLETAGTYCPPFRELTPEEEDQIVELINASGADVVWVGLSTPKQERWMARFLPRLNASALIGVGAAFDFHTGRVRQAPRWIQHSGLEWLFRLTMEPRRLWKRYLRNNPLFLWFLVWERLGLRNFSPG